MCVSECFRLLGPENEEEWCRDCRESKRDFDNDESELRGLCRRDPANDPSHDHASAREWLEYLDTIAPLALLENA